MNSSLIAFGLKYGVRMGLLISVVFLLAVSAGFTENISVTVLRNIIIVGTIVYVHHIYKAQNEGLFIYGDGVKLGTLIVSSGFVISSFTTFIYTRFINTSVLLDLREEMIIGFKEQGVEPPVMAMMEKTLTPEWLFLTGIIGGVFIGFFYSLIISIFTRQRL